MMHLADQDPVYTGERPLNCKPVVSGFACRHEPLGNGRRRRQIVSFHVPSDILDMTSLPLGLVGRGISTVTQAKTVRIPHATLLGWTERQRC